MKRRWSNQLPFYQDGRQQSTAGFRILGFQLFLRRCPDKFRPMPRRPKQLGLSPGKRFLYIGLLLGLGCFLSLVGLWYLKSQAQKMVDGLAPKPTPPPALPGRR